jgi:hypothetical protein
VSDERTLNRVIAHLRAQVAELRRMEREGTATEEIEERRRHVARLQDQLARVALELLGGPGRPLLE